MSDEKHEELPDGRTLRTRTRDDIARWVGMRVSSPTKHDLVVDMVDEAATGDAEWLVRYRLRCTACGAYFHGDVGSLTLENVEANIATSEGARKYAECPVPKDVQP